MPHSPLYSECGTDEGPSRRGYSRRLSMSKERPSARASARGVSIASCSIEEVRERSVAGKLKTRKLSALSLLFFS